MNRDEVIRKINEADLVISRDDMMRTFPRYTLYKYTKQLELKVAELESKVDRISHLERYYAADFDDSTNVYRASDVEYILKDK